MYEDTDFNLFVEIGDCTNYDFMKYVNQKYGPFDIIIDDASHKREYGEKIEFYIMLKYSFIILDYTN